MSDVAELSNAILLRLLADFSDRQLPSEALAYDDGYKGVGLVELKSQSVGDGVSAVDFDLALKDLENAHLISTGPQEPFKNDPYSPVLVVGLFSKREYACLTEKGYKQAQKLRSKARSTAPREGSTNFHVNISGGHFQQSPIGIGHNARQSITATSGAAPVFGDLHRAITEGSIPDHDRAKLLATLEAMETTHKTPNFRETYRKFIAEAADYMSIIGPFIPALAGLLQNITT